MTAIHSSEPPTTLQRHNPEDQYPLFHSRENLRPRKNYFIYLYLLSFSLSAFVSLSAPPIRRCEPAFCEVCHGSQVWSLARLPDSLSAAGEPTHQTLIIAA